MRRWLRDQRGATSIEYALIATLIAVLIVGSVQIYSQRVNAMYNNLQTAILPP